MKARETGRKRFKFPEFDVYGLLCFANGVLCGLYIGLLVLYIVTR